MNQSNRGYFQLQQAIDVAEVFARHEVEYLFIGKSGAIILGYPAATQDVDIFPEKSAENGKKIIEALRELEFDIPDETAAQIVAGSDFVQLNTGPFDLDLVFAPDGIENFDAAKKRQILVDQFPVAHIRDIIASKRASGRQKDLNDLPLLEEFREEYERQMRGEPKTSIEIALEKHKSQDETKK